MDTKQLLNDEDLTAVAGGNQASMNQWSRSVEVISCQLEAMAANASAADQALLRRYIAALKSTCSEAGTESAFNTVVKMKNETSSLPLQDGSIRDRVYNLLTGAYGVYVVLFIMK